MMEQMRQTSRMIKSCGNPQAMINQIMSQNPKVNQIIQQYGGDPKTAFYRYAEANGINPDDVLQMIK